MKRIYLVFLIMLCIVLTGCSISKEVKTLDDFEEICVSNELNVTDNLLNYSNNEYITGAYIAKADDLSIEMVIYDDEDTCEKVQEQQIEAFNKLKSTGNINTRIKGNNYHKYTMISNGYYMVSSRVENTLIFTKTPISNKDTVNKILESMDY